MSRQNSRCAQKEFTLVLGAYVGGFGVRLRLLPAIFVVIDTAHNGLLLTSQHRLRAQRARRLVLHLYKRISRTLAQQPIVEQSSTLRGKRSMLTQPVPLTLEASGSANFMQRE